MKTFSASLLAALCTWGALAQPDSTVPKNIRAANTLENLADAEGLTAFDNLYGIPLEPGGVVGNAYLSPEWKRTTFVLYDADKMLEGFPSRYEIDLDQFEIKSSTGIKVLTGTRVKSFVWIDSLSNSPHYFVNGRDFKDDEQITLSGFYEVLSEGALPLLARTNVVVRKPTYNDKFDLGDRDTRILKKVNFYYLQDGIVRAVPSSKKKVMALFGDHTTAMEHFIRVNKLSLNQALHLRAIFDHYNARLTTN